MVKTAKAAQIIDLALWYHTPAGKALWAWQTQRCDQAVEGCFGYHALQIGGNNLPALRNSRIQHRWLAAVDGQSYHPAPPASPSTSGAAADIPPPCALLLEPHALPFAPDSLDLVILPHTLEASADPRAVLREVTRVLVPEGQLIILGFNPASLWGIQQKMRHIRQKIDSTLPPFIPDVDDFISQRRLCDWLGLLNLHVTASHFGCYRPGLSSPRQFERLHWLEDAGRRWWPGWGGVYMLQATKHTHGLRLIQPRWRRVKQAQPVAAAARTGKAPHPSA